MMWWSKERDSGSLGQERGTPVQRKTRGWRALMCYPYRAALASLALAYCPLLPDIVFVLSPTDTVSG